MPRFLRSLGSFVAIVSVYWVYELVAVPMIEPSMDRPPRALPPEITLEKDARLQSLLPLFPAGHWVLDKPMILQGDQAKLLIQSYENPRDGKIAIRPCVLIFTPPGPEATFDERNRRSIILEAPEGALLEFDQTLDLSQGKIGRLVSGKLKGDVTIRSAGEDPGPGDDLKMTARDVELTEDRIWTPNRVEFTYGASYGSGTWMLIKLLPGDKTDKKNQRAPNIELFELRRLERLHLELTNSDFIPDGKNLKATEQSENQGEFESDLPIEVTCRGAFRFDPIQQVATFEDRVDVLRLRPQGPSDQLNCELLTIYFARSKPSKTEPSNRGSARRIDPSFKKLRFEPRLMVAEGNPVIIRSPQEEVEVRGDWMQYNFADEQIIVKSAHEVSLQHVHNEIHARSLWYQSAGRGRLGRVIAEGPGWLQAAMDDQIGQTLETRWNGELRIRPNQGQQEISLRGGAVMAFGGMGQIRAEEIYFWLFEEPNPDNPKVPKLRPNQMMARRQVQLASMQINGRVDQMEIMFDTPKTQRAATTSQPSSIERNMANRRILERPKVALDPVRNANLLKRHFNVAGRLLRGRMILHETALDLRKPKSDVLQSERENQKPERNNQKLVRNNQKPVRENQKLERNNQKLVRENQKPELVELMLEGDVRLSETRTAKSDDQPILLTGERIHAINVSRPQAVVAVVGSPAHFEGHGLALTGPNIHVNRRANRLSIKGPGQALIPIDRDLKGERLEPPIPLDVRWQRQMSFDGKTVRFDRSVTATSPDQFLRTENLDVVLCKAIQLDKANLDQRPDVHKIVCRGGAFMVNRSFDDQRVLTSIGEMNVADLSIDIVSGDTFAKGPGQVTTVRRGTLVSMDLPGKSQDKPDDPNQLSFLNVRFEDTLSGNFQHHELTFKGQVQTTYGPVNDWRDTLDGDDPDSLGEKGVVVSCDRLGVTQMSGASERSTFELEAVGNTEAEGRDFKARAVRMTFDESKNLLILEGDGRTDAQIFLQDQPPYSALKIQIWPDKNRFKFKIDGHRMLELHHTPKK